jgi:ankyrin repeat protein
MSLLARVNQKGNLFSATSNLFVTPVLDDASSTTIETENRNEDQAEETTCCHHQHDDKQKQQQQLKEDFSTQQENHHHHHECRCITHPPVDNSLVQTLDEVAFDNGIWSIINKNLPTANVREFLIKNKHSSSNSASNYCIRKCPSGYTPLLYAAKQNNLETIALLIDNGADVRTEVTPETKMSALHRAAGVGNYSVCEFLITKGGNEIKSMRDSRGLTAYDWVDQRMFQAKNLDEKTKENLLRLLAP